MVTSTTKEQNGRLNQMKCVGVDGPATIIPNSLQIDQGSPVPVSLTEEQPTLEARPERT
jgi:hypothetical protein